MDSKRTLASETLVDNAVQHGTTVITKGEPVSN